MGIAILSWLVAIPLLGALTGCRSMMPMCIVCWFAYRHHLAVHYTWAEWSANRITVIVFTVLAAGELIGDKLPKTPNRTAAFPLVARVAFGGLIGAICATGLHGSAVEGILLGTISAFAGTFLGFHLRHWLVKDQGFPDLPVAIFEDAIVIALSIFAMGIVTG